jgi:hypothetical protein
MSSDDLARQAELMRQLELVRSDPEAAAAMAATLDLAHAAGADELPAEAVHLDPEPESEPEPEPAAAAAEIDPEQQRVVLLQQKLERVRADPDATVDVLAELSGRVEEAVPDEAASEHARLAQLATRLAEARSSEARAAEIELQAAEAHSADETAAQPAASIAMTQCNVSPDVASLPSSTTASDQATTHRAVQAERKRKSGLFACCGVR